MPRDDFLLDKRVMDAIDMENNAVLKEVSRMAVIRQRFKDAQMRRLLYYANDRDPTDERRP